MDTLQTILEAIREGTSALLPIADRLKALLPPMFSWAMSESPSLMNFNEMSSMQASFQTMDGTGVKVTIAAALTGDVIVTIVYLNPAKVGSVSDSMTLQHHEVSGWVAQRIEKVCGVDMSKAKIIGQFVDLVNKFLTAKDRVAAAETEFRAVESELKTFLVENGTPNERKPGTLTRTSRRRWCSIGPVGIGPMT